MPQETQFQIKMAKIQAHHPSCRWDPDTRQGPTGLGWGAEWRARRLGTPKAWCCLQGGRGGGYLGGGGMIAHTGGRGQPGCWVQGLACRGGGALWGGCRPGREESDRSGPSPSQGLLLFYYDYYVSSSSCISFSVLEGRGSGSGRPGSPRVTWPGGLPQPRGDPCEALGMDAEWEGRGRSAGRRTRGTMSRRVGGGRDPAPRRRRDPFLPSRCSGSCCSPRRRGGRGERGRGA